MYCIVWKNVLFIIKPCTINYYQLISLGDILLFLPLTCIFHSIYLKFKMCGFILAKII